MRRKGKGNGPKRLHGLRRLRRDVAANTLAMMAMAIIPLAGLVGGGVDLSRMYIVKTRLQHACDAGALAGRKAMGGGTWTQSSYYPRTSAERFFDANIQASPYGASNVARSYRESAGKVIGTASATLPMTLMRVFGRTTETLSVSCDAEMRLPNTDVMFVLDTTGSMDQQIPGDTTRKIDGLKTAVKCFYETVARLDTDAVCEGDPPSGGTGDQVQIRFGFMPYATNVNVGRLLPTNYFADKWKYQSREPQWTTTTTYAYPPATGSAPAIDVKANTEVERTNVNTNSQSQCIAPATTTSTATTTANTPVVQSGTTQTSTTTTITTQTTVSYTSVRKIFLFFYYCELTTTTNTRITTSTVTNTSVGVPTTTRVFDKWRYAQIEHDISSLKNGTNWNASVNLPIGLAGEMAPIAWDGCVEERQTVRQASYSPIPSGAKDLDIDLVPVSGQTETLWGPVLRDAIFTRQSTAIGIGRSNWNTAEVSTPIYYSNTSGYYCPTEARRLQSWPFASTFEQYVDSLTPDGNTYHDIGLIWGARFASPTGIFRSDNEYTSQGGEIERHIIFMTDGDTVAQNYDYTAYGVAWFDRRQTDAGSAPSAATLNDQVNARFSAICTAIKNKQITLWVISFGDGTNTTTRDRLKTCATDGRFFQADDSKALQLTFKSIADQISQLRLTR